MFSHWVCDPSMTRWHLRSHMFQLRCYEVRPGAEALAAHGLEIPRSEI